jgi:serine/threonine protein kinase
MHKQEVLHRDLHTANFFVDIQRKQGACREVKVAIADFGQAMAKRDCPGNLPQAFSWYIAPEGFFVERMRPDDYYSTDVYALGCVLYEVYFEKDPPWFKDKYYKSIWHGDAKAKQEQQKHLIYLIERDTKVNREQLKANYATLTPQKKFEYLILRMVHPVAAERGKAFELRNEMAAIIASAQANSASTS